MSDFKVVVDADKVIRVFQRAPLAATRRLVMLVEAGAIDTQNEMRRNIHVGATGDARRSIRYRTNPALLSATIEPNVPYAEDLEKGTRPHWTSAGPGSSLAKWAKAKGINPYAVQQSIAKKGTKAHPYVAPTYRTMLPRVQRLVVDGMGQFARGVDSGLI